MQSTKQVDNMQNYNLIKILQKFPSEHIKNIDSSVCSQLELSGLAPRFCGASIALAVGSRGITDLLPIVRSTISFIQRMGGNPFIIPAMGSHGGASAQGQKALLEAYGISENTLKVPVVSSMEVVELPSNGLPNRVFMSKPAFESDGVILINRIKPHTDFHGRYESGLVKMSVIGLGKHAQAMEIHKFGVLGLKELIPQTAERVLSTGKILLGLGIVENSCDRAVHIEAIPHDRILEREPELLDLARLNMPSLPLEDIDVLIVDRSGKDISGVGMDPWIIGRMRINGEPEPSSPRIKSIFVADLTEKSLGNALGIGLADVISRRLFNKINFDETYENAFTSTFLERAKIPVIAENDRKGLEFALRNCGAVSLEEARIVRIRDTLHIDQLYVSPNIWDTLKTNGKIELISGPCRLFEGERLSSF